MGEQRNLTEENVEELKEQLERMKIGNPDIEYAFFEQDEKEPRDEVDCFDSCKMHEKIDALERKIDLIFGGHVLIDGEFKKI